MLSGREYCLVREGWTKILYISEYLPTDHQYLPFNE